MNEATDTHKLTDPYATWDGYGIRCSCGFEWAWNGDSDFTLDDMAREAKAHEQGE